MPITWNAEADAKLFLGVLAQVKHLKVKLDHQALAEYMGDGCTACAIDNRIVRLRRQVEGLDMSKVAPATPTKTPTKASTKRKPATPKSAKKSKAKVIDDNDDDVNMEDGLVKEEPDKKAKVEVQLKSEGMGSDWPDNV